MMHSLSEKGREFAGQVCVVTGAASGIGAAVAEALARQGASLLLLDRQAEALQAFAQNLAGEGCALAVEVLDLRDGAAIEAALAQAVRHWGRIDLLVNVAGVLHAGDTASLSDEAWEESFAVNTTAVFRLCRAASRQMRQQRSGCILTVGSNAAHVPRLGMAAYGASKAATVHFMRCLGLELASLGIRCNTVSPGSTDTPMQHAFASTPEQIERVLQGDPERYRLGIPLGRIASPQDIAEAICFLASSRARHITLQDLVIDGGATLGA